MYLFIRGKFNRIAVVMSIILISIAIAIYLSARSEGYARIITQYNLMPDGTQMVNYTFLVSDYTFCNKKINPEVSIILNGKVHKLPGFKTFDASPSYDLVRGPKIDMIKYPHAVSVKLTKEEYSTYFDDHYPIVTYTYNDGSKYQTVLKK